MKRFAICLLCLLLAGQALAPQVQAQQPLVRLIVRDKLGLTGLTKTCKLLGCSVVRSLGDSTNQLFLVTLPNIPAVNRLLVLLSVDPAVTGIELDQLLGLPNNQTLAGIPQSLSDVVPQTYYGAIVPRGYLTQPANLIIRTSDTQSQLRVTGAGTVAVIDTGVDVSHPVLHGVLLPGYDFTRNSAGADETGDIDHSTAAVLDVRAPKTTKGSTASASGPDMVDPWLAANLSPHDAALLSSSQYAGFGHGTMTAGLIHLVAPTAKILPLKAFSSDGTGYLSDVIRAINYATAQKAKVVSLSFEFASTSKELNTAISAAQAKGLICVASAGNDGKKIRVYPASVASVAGVASTSNFDSLSSFSNYGSQVVWIGAPGEEVVSTYPFGIYASSSGTSFSAPLVAGTAALFVSVAPTITQTTANQAFTHARWSGADMNYGRLDTYQAVKAWQGMRH